MKVKVGDKVYSAEDHPIMVILEEEDKDNIKTCYQLIKSMQYSLITLEALKRCMIGC